MYSDLTTRMVNHDSDALVQDCCICSIWGGGRVGGGVGWVGWGVGVEGGGWGWGAAGQHCGSDYGLALSGVRTYTWWLFDSSGTWHLKNIFTHQVMWQNTFCILVMMFTNFLEWKSLYLIRISLKIKGPINNMPALDQITGCKPLPEPMMA